jgi:hypothetical protein
MQPTVQPRAQEVVLTVGQRHQIVAAEDNSDVRIGRRSGRREDLGDVVYALLVDAGGERYVQILHRAHHRAAREVPHPRLAVHAVDSGGEVVEGRTALLDRRHVRLRPGHTPWATRLATLAHVGRRFGYRRGVDDQEDPSTELEATGVPAADSALERLRDIDTAPLEDHVEIFDDVQQRLHEGLAELDDEQ